MELISYKTLLTPISHIPTAVETNTIKSLLRQYRSLYINSKLNWESKYSHIDGYLSYVYMISDLTKDKYYIGVRFTPNRLKDELIEDLLEYQSSSTDKKFKKLLKEDVETNKGNGRFKLDVIQVFDNELDAQNYEALLHQIFQVDINPQFYNRYKEHFKELKVYFTPLYDLQEEKEVYFKDICDVVSYKSISSIINGNTKYYVKDKYCLLSNIGIATKEYKKQNEIITLYTHDQKGKIWSESKPYKEWATKLQGFAGFYSNTVFNSLYQYFKTYNNCVNDMDRYMKYVDLFTFDKDKINTFTKSVYEWSQLLGKDFSILHKKSNYIKGYFTSLHLCRKHQEREYKLITLYKFNKVNKTPDKISKKYDEWYSILGGDFITMFKREQHMVKNHYISYDRCVLDNVMYSFIDKNNHKTELWRDECQVIIGKGYGHLITGKCMTFKGWKLIRYNELA